VEGRRDRFRIAWDQSEEAEPQREGAVVGYAGEEVAVRGGRTAVSRGMREPTWRLEKAASAGPGTGSQRNHSVHVRVQKEKHWPVFSVLTRRQVVKSYRCVA